MTVKNLMATLFFLSCLLQFSNAQSFSLGSFYAGRDQLKKNLNLTGARGAKFDNIYAQLNKNLLKINNEIIGKNRDQITRLISGKYKTANDSFLKILHPDEMAAVQTLNNSQMAILTNGLAGKNGLAEANGLIDREGRAAGGVRKRVVVIVESGRK
jgi:hypothetical protein